MVNNKQNVSWTPFIFAGFGILMVVAMSVFTIKSANKTSLLHRDLAQTTYDLSRLDKLMSDMKTYLPIIASVRHSLPNGYAEVAAAITRVEALAKTNNIALDTSLEDAAKSSSLGVKLLQVSMHIAGSYTDMRNFISHVTNLPYHFDVSTLTVDNNSGPLEGLITMELYIQ